MNIYNRSAIIGFYKKHPDCRETLEKWHYDVCSKSWKKPSDVTRDYNTARTIKNSRAIFKINGNDYGIIIAINYFKNWVFIKFIGTHAECDKIDAATVNLFPSKKKK
jgi:mRNA interferase HigB